MRVWSGAFSLSTGTLRPVDLAVAALAKAGFHGASGSLTQPMPPPVTESITLPVLEMTCASCQHHVEEALRSRQESKPHTLT